MGARVFIAQRVRQHAFAIDHNGLRQGCIQFKRCAMENQMYKVINVLLIFIPGLLGQSINKIAAHQFIGGLLIIKDGEIVVENYYGTSGKL